MLNSGGLRLPEVTLSDVLKALALPTDLKQIIGCLYMFRGFERGPVFAGTIISLHWPRRRDPMLYLTVTEGVIYLSKRVEEVNGKNVLWQVREFRQNGREDVKYELSPLYPLFGS